MLGIDVARRSRGPGPPTIRRVRIGRAELARFHYDTALAANAPAMAAVTKIAPISQILLGTDFPLRPSGYQVAALQKLFNPDELAQIETENALRLFPRLRTL